MINQGKGHGHTGTGDIGFELDPAERFELVDQVLHSPVKPDQEIDRNLIDEAERRLAAYRAGKVKGGRAVGEF